jgi:hypothetical protein
MDTSKAYIMMCRQAEEIQKTERMTNVFNIKHDFIKYVSEGCGNVSVWLPRQDQLQKMLDGEPLNELDQLYDFKNSSSDIFGCTNSEKFTTLEQLWLVFVMHKKYGKIWNGKEWIASIKD